MKYRVILSEVRSMEVIVEAPTAMAAEEFAWEQARDNGFSFEAEDYELGATVIGTVADSVPADFTYEDPDDE